MRRCPSLRPAVAAEVPIARYCGVERLGLNALPRPSRRALRGSRPLRSTDAGLGAALSPSGADKNSNDGEQEEKYSKWIRTPVARSGRTLEEDEGNSNKEATFLGKNTFGDITRRVLDAKARVSTFADKASGEDGTGVGTLSDAVWGGLCAGLAMAVIGLMDVHIKTAYGLPFILGSFGTIGVLLFATPQAPVVKLWNICMGHAIAAGVIVAATKVLTLQTVYLRSIAYGITITLMLLGGAVHPPGGALVLIFLENVKCQALGWGYILYPGLTGALILYAASRLCVLLRNNIVF